MWRAWLAKIYIYIQVQGKQQGRERERERERGKKNKKGFGVLSWRRSEMGPSGVVKGRGLE
jgi:hypothetical protein